MPAPLLACEWCAILPSSQSLAEIIGPALRLVCSCNFGAKIWVIECDEGCTAAGVLGGDIKVEARPQIGAVAEQALSGVADCSSLCSLLAARSALLISKESLGCRRLGMVNIVMLLELRVVLTYSRIARSDDHSTRSWQRPASGLPASPPPKPSPTLVVPPIIRY